MSRLQPYRNRVPTHIIKLLDVSSRITLFLVGQNGPLSFIFKDRLQNKYKTMIGSEVKCSCSPNKNDHCIHSLYVLLKIFKISVQNPIIWQASYIDSELSDIISGKHTVIPVRQRITRPNFEIQQQVQILPSDFYLKKQIKRKFVESVQKVKPLDLEEDSVCPICQQDMKKDMCLTYCKAGCGNNYHLQCLKVWISHKKNEESKVTCPMCRQEFHSSIFQQIKNQETEWKKKQMIKKSHKYQCNSCGVQQIPKNVHKCILCQKFSLCEACYLAKKHIKHPFMRRNEVGQWQAAEQRRAGELKIKQFIDGKRKQSKNKQILEKLRESKQLSLLDFICSAYPYVSKYISDNIDPYRKLNLQPETMQCLKCGSKRIIFLRRLSCGHFIDHECLKQNIRKGITYCEKDGDKLVKGYQNMLQEQKEIKYEQQKIELQVNGQFSEANMLMRDVMEEQNRQQQQQEQQYQQEVIQQTQQVVRTARRSIVSHNSNQQRQQRQSHINGQNQISLAYRQQSLASNNNINNLRVNSSNQAYRIRPSYQSRDLASVHQHNNMDHNNLRNPSIRSRLNLNLLFNSNPSNQPTNSRQSQQRQISINKRTNANLNHANRLQKPQLEVGPRNITQIGRKTTILNSILPNLQDKRKNNRNTVILNSNHPFFAT